MIVKFAHWIIRRRFLVLAVWVLAIALLAAGGQRLSFSNDYRSFFGKENPELNAFETLQDVYTKNDNVLFMLEPKNGEVFTRETLAAVVELTEAAWQLPYSIRVDSISNFQHTYAAGDDLTVEDLIAEPAALSDAEIERIKQIALAEPLLVNRLVSPGAHATGVNVTVQFPGINSTEEVPAVVKPTRELLAEFEARYPDIDFYLTGVVMMNNAFPEASFGDFQTLVPLALAAVILGLVLFLRSLSGTIVTVLIIVISIIAAMGTAGWLGIVLTPPSATAPTMILTLAVADCVHLLVSFLFHMRRGMSKHDAIVESMRINFSPVFLTSLTTAIGFLSLNFSDAPPFNDLGNITAIGVMYAFFLAVTLLPALMAVLPIHESRGKQTDRAMMLKFAEFVIARRTVLLWSMSAMVLVTAAFITKNELNDEFVEYFDERIAFRTHTDHITDNLTGMYFIDYSLASGEDNGISNPVFQQQIQAFTEWLKRQPEVLHVNSYTDIMKRLNKNMHGDDPAMYKLPEERDLAAQYILLYEMSLPYGLDLNNQINIDKSATRLSVSLKSISSNEMLALEQRAAAWLDTHAPAISTQGSSPALMFAHIGQRNIKSMLIGMTLALLLISAVLIVALRSWKYGLISLLPNLLPGLVAFGLWGLINGQIGLALSVVAGMTLGIVVDDTVHFLSKYLRARRENHLDAAEAVRYAFSSVGVALVVTTLVLMAGFMVLSFSAFELNASMGLMTAITVGIALAIDFLFLPPLLMKIEEKTNENTRNETATAEKLAA